MSALDHVCSACAARCQRLVTDAEPRPVEQGRWLVPDTMPLRLLAAAPLFSTVGHISVRRQGERPHFRKPVRGHTISTHLRIWRKNQNFCGPSGRANALFAK